MSDPALLYQSALHNVRALDCLEHDIVRSLSALRPGGAARAKLLLILLSVYSDQRLARQHIEVGRRRMKNELYETKTSTFDSKNAAARPQFAPEEIGRVKSKADLYLAAGIKELGRVPM